MPDELSLLERLVAIQSVSGEEATLAAFVEETARGWGLDVVRDETSVRVEVCGRSPGATLGLVSHLDVVPPGGGWTRDPFTPTIEGDKLLSQIPAIADGHFYAETDMERTMAATNPTPLSIPVIVSDFIPNVAKALEGA